MNIFGESLIISQTVYLSSQHLLKSFIVTVREGCPGLVKCIDQMNKRIFYKRRQINKRRINLPSQRSANSGEVDRNKTPKPYRIDKSRSSVKIVNQLNREESQSPGYHSFWGASLDRWHPTLVFLSIVDNRWILWSYISHIPISWSALKKMILGETHVIR